jgi:hypothetical protein
MTDTLKAPILFGFTGDALSELGIVPLTDNYGNSTQGSQLDCTGHEPVTMSVSEMTELHRSIVPNAMVAFNLKGEITILDGQSPLETMCEKLHHVSPNLPKPEKRERNR